MIDDDTGKKLKSEVIQMVDLARILKYFLLAVGLVLILCAVVVVACFLYRRQRSYSVITFCVHSVLGGIAEFKRFGCSFRTDSCIFLMEISVFFL